jgi:hypothetical protein
MKNYFMKILLTDYLQQVKTPICAGRPLFTFKDDQFTCIGDFAATIRAQIKGAEKVLVSIRNTDDVVIFPISHVWIEVPVIIDLTSSDL